MGTSEITKPQVMILGTFHMSYTPDLHRPELDDFLSHERQEEIQEIVQRIKGFQPTKIAFEVVKEKDDELNHDYSSYLAGKFQLKVDEIHQIGFRLASQMNHDRIYAIDWMESVGNIGYGQVYEWAEQHQPNVLDYIKQIDPPSEFNKNSEQPILDMLQRINDPDELIKPHEQNMHLARIGEGTNYVGIDWLRWWYQRNLILYSNITEITGEGDRTLFLVGFAHTHLVSQFLKESGMFEVVDASQYLGQTVNT